MLLRIFVLLSFFVMAISGYGQNDVWVAGKVLEATGFHLPIPNATVKIMKPDSSLVASLAADECSYETYRSETEYTGKKYTGGFSVRLPREGGKYIISVSSLNYSTVMLDIDLGKLDKREYSLRLDPIYLEESSVLMDEVMIKASKVKFHYKGDTLVYTADAFKLAEGSMLDALIQQLPNVDLKDDGTIYVNGKYVEELLLNGRQFFDNNKQLMLQNLAAYTVKNVEVYEKLGMRGELVGKDMGDNRLVMDVKLKKEYMVGTALNIEGGYGSSDRYLGRLFGMAFTPTGQYAVYINTNNLNNSQKPGQNTSWTPEKMPTGIRKSISGGLDYNIKTLDNRWEVNGNLSVASSRESDGTDVLRANFLTSGNTYDYQFNRSKNKSLSFDTRHRLGYKAAKLYSLTVSPYFNYRKWNNYSEDIDATFDSELNDVSTEFIDNIYGGGNTAALASLINRRINMSRQKGHSLSTGGTFNQSIRFQGYKILSLDLFGNYNNRYDERFNHYDINFGTNPIPTENTTRYFKNHPDFDYNFGSRLSYSFSVGRGQSLTMSYQYKRNYRKGTSDLFLLETPESVEDFISGMLPSAIDYELTLDRSNSYLSRQTDDDHMVMLGYRYSQKMKNGKDLYIQADFPLTLANRKLEYQRGTVDTTFIRRTVLFDLRQAIVDIGDSFEGPHVYSFYIRRLQSQAPDMVNMIDFTDTTDPLYIVKGNKGLKNSLQADFGLKYRYINKERRITAGGALDFFILSNALSQGYTYNTETGIREGSYYNVNGNWNMKGSLFYNQQFNNGFTLINQFTAGHATSVDLVGENSPQLFRSKVYNLNFADKLNLEYRFAKHRLSLDVSAQYDRYSSNRTDFTEQNTWTIKSGINAVFELPANFQLATDMTVYTRRGYTDELLNTDNYVWNARLTYRALKGKLLLSLDGYDILHDLSNVSYTMNAQARTETYRTVLPHYAMFRMQWLFNHSPKSKK